jgi:hypothetical protein
MRLGSQTHGGGLSLESRKTVLERQRQKKETPVKPWRQIRDHSVTTEISHTQQPSSGEV